MISAHGRGRLRTAMGLLLTVGVTGGLCSALAAAQRESQPVDLPDGPASDGFDIDRFSNVGNGWFETFHVEDTEPLAEVLQDGRVANETRVLVIETAAGPLAFLQAEMAYHHIAEGRAGGKDWMATF